MNTPAARKNQEVAEILENRILPEVRHAQWLELQSWPHEGTNVNEDVLVAGIAFLRGENPNLSAFLTGSSYRWQGPAFVIWLKEILEAHLEGQHPPITAKEILEWMTPFLTGLLHHEDLP
jgi:hypothetical protein